MTAVLAAAWCDLLAFFTGMIWAFLVGIFEGHYDKKMRSGCEICGNMYLLDE